MLTTLVLSAALFGQLIETPDSRQEAVSESWRPPGFSIATWEALPSFERNAYRETYAAQWRAEQQLARRRGRISPEEQALLRQKHREDLKEAWELQQGRAAESRAKRSGPFPLAPLYGTLIGQARSRAISYVSTMADSGRQAREFMVDGPGVGGYGIFTPRDPSLLGPPGPFMFWVEGSRRSDGIRVEGYRRSDGIWVDGHWRSGPDGIIWNNWSTYGNVNPHTGIAGTRRYP